MQNVKMEVKGTVLTVTVDLAKNFGRSASGKSTIIATTSGNQPVTLPDGSRAFLGLNVYAK